MGEQPLFVCKAHVFQLEPELKKTWLPLSSNAVNVQLFHDPIKNIYRIVSVEGTKALINSIITNKMTFTKTSQKFGQWIDFKMNVVYGLGFSNDAELNKFVEKFKEIKELTRSSAIKTLHPHERSNSVEIAQVDRQNSYDSAEAQLKYENDRLKLALAQSSGNARKWEEELQILKNNNARLTTALQESHSNVEEWKKQLQFYKDECGRLRTITAVTTVNNNDDHDSSNNSGETTTTAQKSNDLNNNTTIKHRTPSTTSNQQTKQEITKLIDLFDQKFNELYEIKNQLKKLVNDVN